MKTKFTNVVLFLFGGAFEATAFTFSSNNNGRIAPYISKESATKLFYLEQETVTNNQNIGTIKVHNSPQVPTYKIKCKIYCDLDGCLVNFEKGIRTLFNKGSSNLKKSEMWDKVSKVPNWFEQLEWTDDGKRLWNTIKHLNPDILTGVPNIDTSRFDKFNWCRRELGIDEETLHHVDMCSDPLMILLDVESKKNDDHNNTGDKLWGKNDHGKSLWIDVHKSVNGNFPRDKKTNIITCWSKNKYKECRMGSILIDDRIELKKDWEDAGGIFIHHINAESTIQKLNDISVL